MTRGMPTDPQKVEEAKMVAATTGNIAEAGRAIGVPRNTAHNIVMSDDDFEQFRTQVQKKYILNTWENILAIETALRRKIEEEDISKLNLREITGALNDLKRTVENVVQNINIDKAVFIPLLGGDSVHSNNRNREVAETTQEN